MIYTRIVPALLAINEGQCYPQFELSEFVDPPEDIGAFVKAQFDLQWKNRTPCAEGGSPIKPSDDECILDTQKYGALVADKRWIGPVAQSLGGIKRDLIQFARKISVERLVYVSHWDICCHLAKIDGKELWKLSFCGFVATEKQYAAHMKKHREFFRTHK